MTILEASDIKKTFKLPGLSPIHVLNGVNLKVERGEKVAILGRSGAGKSTLLNILGGLEKPTEGIVLRPKNIGFIFQSYHLMNELTVLENVMLPTMRGGFKRREAKARALELLEKVALSHRLDHLPGELSGGERQRVALARALVTSPELVLADEPTGNLDALTGADILNIFTELSAGSHASLVIVTHSREAAAICDRVLTLKDGVLGC